MTKLVDLIRIALCTSFGLGYSPVMPGTVGTLPAVLIFLAVCKAVRPECQTAVLGACLAVSCVLSIALGSWAERYWGRKDPRRFVLDEVAGFFLTVLLFRTPDLLLTTVWAFVSTRVFDIIKPPPAAQMERLPKGWGMLLDDLAASGYAAAFLHVGAWIVPWMFGASG